MPTQMSRVSRNPRLRRNQIAELNARQALLPQIIANQRRQEDLQRQEALNVQNQANIDRSFGLDKSRFAAEKSMFAKQQKAAKRSAQVGAGIEAGKLGMSVLNRFGGTTVDKALQSAPGGNLGKGIGGALGNVNVGSAIGGGLLGYGASQLVGGKNKFKKAAIGAGAGALGGFLSGGVGDHIGKINTAVPGDGRPGSVLVPKTIDTDRRIGIPREGIVCIGRIGGPGEIEREFGLVGELAVRDGSVIFGILIRIEVQAVGI